MKAIQVPKTGGVEVLTLVDIPTPKPKPSEVIVKIAAAGVNYIDVYFREGRYPVTPPFILGQEASGVVSEVGSEVKDFNAGERVAYTGITGAYAEYEAVPADRLVRVPAGITDHQAAAAMLQGMTAHYLTHSTYPLKKGEIALVHAAAGGVGLLLVQMSKNLGARVIATVSTEEKAKLAREAGADDVIFYTKQDFEVETKRLTDGKGVHVIYDGVGKSTFDQDLNVLRPRGYLALFGASSGPVPLFDLGKLAQKGSLFITRPTLVHHIASHEELIHRSTDVFNMIGSGKLKLRIEHLYSLPDAQQANRDLEGRKTTGKLLLIP
jgi:NADPH2:quinone reductase